MSSGEKQFKIGLNLESVFFGAVFRSLQKVTKSRKSVHSLNLRRPIYPWILKDDCSGLREDPF